MNIFIFCKYSRLLTVVTLATLLWLPLNFAGIPSTLIISKYNTCGIIIKWSVHSISKSNKEHLNLGKESAFSANYVYKTENYGIQCYQGWWWPLRSKFLKGESRYQWPQVLKIQNALNTSYSKAITAKKVFCPPIHICQFSDCIYAHATLT